MLYSWLSFTDNSLCAAVISWWFIIQASIYLELHAAADGALNSLECTYCGTQTPLGFFFLQRGLLVLEWTNSKTHFSSVVYSSVQYKYAHLLNCQTAVIFLNITESSRLCQIFSTGGKNQTFRTADTQGVILPLPAQQTYASLKDTNGNWNWLCCPFWSTIACWISIFKQHWM